MKNTPLPFALIYEQTQLISLEDAFIFLLNLPPRKLTDQHWQDAHTAIGCACIEPEYLHTAFIALELALTLDALVDPDLLSFPT